MARPESESSLDSFRRALAEAHDWPCVYTFKFIAPKAKQAELEALFGDVAELSARESSGGRYVSITAEMEAKDPEEVVMVYQRAASIDGLVSL